ATSSGTQNNLQSQPGAGRAVQLEGEVEVVYQDLKGQQSRLLHTLKLSDGRRIQLQFADEPAKHLQSGQHVRVSGQLSDGSLNPYSDGTTTTTTTTTTSSGTPLPNTFGSQSTLVILVSFQDLPSDQPWTAAQVQNEVFASSGMSGFLQEASYGQTLLAGNVF